jgi:hypothetical protein
VFRFGKFVWNYSGKYYAAFVIGPDGHNIEVVCHEAGD